MSATTRVDYATGEAMTDPQGEKIRRTQTTDEVPEGVDITVESAPKAKVGKKTNKEKKMLRKPGVVLRRRALRGRRCRRGQ